MVLRDGEHKFINTEDVVPGDILHLEGSGGNFSFIPGDLRIIKIHAPLYIESYFLYKESLNYFKEMTAEKTSDDPLETGNLIFHGTRVFSGSCKAMVFNTGAKVLLNDVGYDTLATPEIPDSDDDEGRKYQTIIKIKFFTI